MAYIAAKGLIRAVTTLTRITLTGRNTLLTVGTTIAWGTYAQIVVGVNRYLTRAYWRTKTASTRVYVVFAQQARVVG